MICFDEVNRISLGEFDKLRVYYSSLTADLNVYKGAPVTRVYALFSGRIRFSTAEDRQEQRGGYGSPTDSRWITLDALEEGHVRRLLCDFMQKRNVGWIEERGWTDDMATLVHTETLGNLRMTAVFFLYVWFMLPYCKVLECALWCSILQNFSPPDHANWNDVRIVLQRTLDEMCKRLADEKMVRCATELKQTTSSSQGECV